MDEDENVAPGMKLDVVTTELEEGMDRDDAILPARKVPERKTRLQRQKAARHTAEVGICAHGKLSLTLAFSNGH